MVDSHCEDGKTITLYFKSPVEALAYYIYSDGDRGSSIERTEVDLRRSTIVDPQSTSGFLFQHASNFLLKWLDESNADDEAVIYEKQITLVMQTPSWYL
ncbi:hypothetical protein ALC62_00216 [Cyphomyrmex costatus]|uniref:Uncharacterized protein n=1 Tax=Cyphomyrmex costatus TaxID=456900 RepID=A0A195D795_9HYME|nr:hypothetical protein ALC62_00216 [Cyphomyrmex costatus]